MTSQDKHKRKGYVPTWPTRVNPRIPGVQLRLADQVPLRKPGGYVRVDNVFTLPLSMLQRYDYRRPVDTFQLDPASLLALCRCLQQYNQSIPSAALVERIGRALASDTVLRSSSRMLPALTTDDLAFSSGPQAVGVKATLHTSYDYPIIQPQPRNLIEAPSSSRYVPVDRLPYRSDPGRPLLPSYHTAEGNRDRHQSRYRFVVVYCLLLGLALGLFFLVRSQVSYIFRSRLGVKGWLSLLKMMS